MTPAQLTALNSEIKGRADCAAAMAARDLDALAAIVSANRTATAKVPVLDVKAYFHANNAWLGIKAAQNDMSKSVNGRAASQALVEFANSGCVLMDVTTANVAAQLGLLVTDGVITPAQKAAVIAMGTVPASVTRADIEAAMFNPDGTPK